MALTRNQILAIAAIAVGSIILASILFDLPSNGQSKKGFDPTTKWYNDTHTKSIVMHLHPKIQNDFAELFTQIEKQLGLSVYATSGHRSFEKQAELKNENPKNAAPGYSSHNYGFAADVNIRDKQGNIFLQKNSPREKWEKSGVVKLAKSMGFLWGGDFKSYHDPVHFYKEPKGMNTAELLALYKAGKHDADGYVLV